MTNHPVSPYRVILAPVSDADSSASALSAAIRLTQSAQAHLRLLHVKADPATAVPLVGEGMSGAMVDEMISVAERQSKERATAARALADSLLAKAGLPVSGFAPGGAASASWVEETGREEDVVAQAARLSDLVVLGRPVADQDLPSMLTLNAALMEGGRAVLVVPPVAPPQIGRRIAIAWNGSHQAARAVAAALPLLARAESVACFSGQEDVAVPPADLAGYLAFHGVQAKCQSFHDELPVGEALLRHCADWDADLLVMGAYTHSRLRQMIMGGVTRHVLHESGIPLLMSH